MKIERDFYEPELENYIITERAYGAKKNKYGKKEQTSNNSMKLTTLQRQS